MNRWLRACALLTTALATSTIPYVYGCAANGGAQSGDPLAFEASTTPQPEGTFKDGGAEASAEIPDCEEGVKQIFVLGADKGLYRFYPDELRFEHLGVVGCPTTAGTFSMGIDRKGIAWVEFMDGRLFAVNTRDGSCVPTAFQPGQAGFKNFGMGFAKRNDGSNDETLFVSGDGLAALDTTTLQLKFLGSLTFGRTELTGLGSELYAFAVGSGVIAKLDPATGATLAVHRSTAIGERAAFAFAQWGGDFWLFTGSTMSQVTKYSPATDTSTVVVENAGTLIVGAGSSTCAPIKPVH